MAVATSSRDLQTTQRGLNLQCEISTKPRTDQEKYHIRRLIISSKHSSFFFAPALCIYSESV